MSRESDGHYHAKVLLARMISSATSPLIVTLEVGTRFRSFMLDVSGMKPVIECAYPTGEAIIDADLYYCRHGRYPEMIFDIGLIRDGVIVGAFEVICTHGIDLDKRRKIAKSGIMALGVSSRVRGWYTDHVRIECCDYVIPPTNEGLLMPIKTGAA